MTVTSRKSAQNSGVVQTKAKPRGKPFTGPDDPRRNNGGVPREARELRELLKGEAEEIHQQLAALRRAGNVPAILYSHRQLVGDAPGALDVSITGTVLAAIQPHQPEALDPARAAAVLKILAAAGARPMLHDGQGGYVPYADEEAGEPN